MGLELTPVQGVYWRAVQRRMVLGQLEDLINENNGLFKTIPYDLAVALVRHDPGESVIGQSIIILTH